MSLDGIFVDASLNVLILLLGASCTIKRNRKISSYNVRKSSNNKLNDNTDNSLEDVIS
jgi:hypothetical protein